MATEARQYVPGDQCVLECQQFERLFETLRARGYKIVGPTISDGAIVYDELRSVSDLPRGWTDEQAAGRYRLQKRQNGAWFSYAVGPHSWKKFLHPPLLRLWTAERTDGGFSVTADQQQPPRLALVGVRACELHAIAIQDRVFLQGPAIDLTYKARRDRVFVIAVQCGEPGGTCFCVSMNTGPGVSVGFDLALTEILTDDRHYFVVEVGTQRGAELLSNVPCCPASHEDRHRAAQVIAGAAARMGRHMDTTEIKQLLYRNLEHPRWDDVATRCIACANCTMVCPTCFCTTVEDVTDLQGEKAERWRKWDSCFTAEFSYIHGGSVRATIRARYRQWLTHKLATWIDQFGTSGCVGCGRCITWCPVGIDITQEVQAIRESDGAAHAQPLREPLVPEKTSARTS